MNFQDILPDQRKLYLTMSDGQDRYVDISIFQLLFSVLTHSRASHFLEMIIVIS